jgi:myo-inositol-1(or 4)-monophosphatase
VPVTADPALAEHLRDVAVTAAREAAQWLRAERPVGRVLVEATKSSPTDPVTAFDTAVQEMLHQRLSALRPDDGFLGEEGLDEQGGSGVVWVLDPIDGTVNFMYGIPAFAVSVAAQVDGVSLAGCVVEVTTGEEFAAARAAGATVRASASAPAMPLQMPPAPPLNLALVATGFNYDLDTRRRQAASVGVLLAEVRDIRRFGAASLDLCAVAAGRVDAFVERGLNRWDVAAGGLVAQEAGAVLTGIDAEPLGRRLVVATSPGLLDPLQDLVERSGF